MNKNQTHIPWYQGIARYQWLVLLIASLGWIFDQFEAQIFVTSMNEAMPSLLAEGTTKGWISFYNNIAFGAFLLGGALGGVVFGIMSDRIGRTKTMIITILMYSLFTCVTAAAQNWWQMAILRFLVAMGVGGEWAVASAMIAEVFPKRARAWSGAIFQASSVFGAYLAIFAGAFIVADPRFGWRWGFAIGALPALLTLWIRWSLKEPKKWEEAKAAEAKQGGSEARGRLVDLFARDLLGKTTIGVLLAATGMATCWGVYIYGKDLMRQTATTSILLELEMASDATQEMKDEALLPYKKGIKQQEMLGHFLVITGGGIGLVLFGPLCDFVGRRRAFALFFVVAFGVSIVLFQLFAQTELIRSWCARSIAPDISLAKVVLLVALPIFGAFGIGFHAGFAIYFPELFPTRLRGTGGGFCFNVGRILAVPILLLSGWFQGSMGMTLHQSVSLLTSLYLVGLVLLLFAPETRDLELPD